MSDDREAPAVAFDSQHQTVWALLPWAANGTLDAHEGAEVAAHTGHCLLCRRELILLRNLADFTMAPPTESACEAALQRLSARLDRGPAPAPALPWMSAAVLVLVCGLLTWVAGNTEASTAWLRNAGYSMLSEQRVERTAIGGPQVRLVFYDDVTERELRTLLLLVGAVVVEGPTPQGVYTVAFVRDISRAQMIEALRTLRHSRRVMFAEPAVATKVSQARDW